MQSISSIKKRINSIQITKKITNTAKLVAFAKIKTQKNITEATSVYCTNYYNIFKNLLLTQPNLDFLKTKQHIHSKSNLYILISSNMGFCGSYNINICKCLLNEITPNDKIIVFGVKGINFLKINKLDKQIIKSFNYDIDSYHLLLPICYQILFMYCNSKIEKIKIVFTKFETSLHYKAKILDVLSNNLLKENNKFNQNTIIEPNPKEIIKKSIPFFLANLIYGALSESKLCELCSRKFAMENATKNADEIIDNLKTQYNQIRQESITQEINEIIYGTIKKE